MTMAEVDQNKEKKAVADLDKELSEFTESTQTQPKRRAPLKKQAAAATAKKVAKKKKQTIVTRGKRKEAIARASMSQGSGTVTINGVSAALIKPKEIRDLILEPILISKTVSGMMKQYDVSINVTGGGIMGQAQAARTALAKAITESSQNDGIKRAYMLYDRSLLVDDHRRVEPKKMGGPKARARTQTSYR